MRMLIGDRWLDKDEKIDVLDPYDGALVDTVPDGGPEDVAAALRSAEEDSGQPGAPVPAGRDSYRAAGIVRSGRRVRPDHRQRGARPSGRPARRPAGASTP